MATTATAVPGDVLVEPHPGGLTRSGVARLDAIDMMRGLVIAIMVLDHVRDFFHAGAFALDPTDPAQSYPALFATRWITHLCAPTFVLLSGVSIYFQRANGKTGTALSRFLLTRGLWLVFIEVTLVSFGFNFGPPFFLLQVIWAIGWSMVAMAALAHLPSRAVLAIGIAMVALSPIFLPPFAPASDAATIVIQLLFGGAPVAGAPIFIAYAIVPWLGVMAIGFGLAPLFAQEGSLRRRRLAVIGIALVAAFLLLRSLNGYGNPEPWRMLDSPARTIMSFLNVFKYPPSPDFVAVTVGLSLLLFTAVERLTGPLARILGDFGRTPLFTYLAHIYIAHGLMLVVAIVNGTPDAAINIFGQAFAGPGATPANWGYSLPIVYMTWVVVLAMLVPLSRWFAGVKRRRRDWWLSYL